MSPSARAARSSPPRRARARHGRPIGRAGSWLAARPACPAPMTTVVTRSMAWPLRLTVQATSTVTFVGFVRASKTAERFWDWATSASMSSFEASASMLNVTLMSLKPLRTSLSAPRMPADVVMALDGRLDRTQLDAAVLRDGRHARRQAAGQADDEVLDRRDPGVRRRENLGVVGFEHRLFQVALLLPEAEEALDLHRAVHAALPLGGCAPGELSGLWRALQHIACIQQRLNVDSVGNLVSYPSSLSLCPRIPRWG